MGKTIYLNKTQIMGQGISLSDLPSAGPNANITGMRNKYWGKDCTIIKHGRYIYKLS